MLILKDVKRTFNPGKPNEVRALRGVNLEIADGEMLAIMGASGSGKSTLLHILGCLDDGFDGEYSLSGKSVHALSRRELAEIRNSELGVVLQNFGLIENMSVADNIAVPSYIGRGTDKELNKKIAALAEKLGIADKLKTDVSELSGGQKQRVAIARALIKSPKIILADEPTGALDRENSRQIVAILSELNAEGYTVVIVTHDPGVAQKCHRTVNISDGVIA